VSQDVVVDVAAWMGLVILVIGLMKFAYVPLAVAFEAQQWRRNRARQVSGWGGPRPSVSVIVPAYNEAAVLATCVRSILRSGYDDLEVVVVDDGSSDRTPEVMRRLAAEDARVVTVSQPNAGKGAALNRGVAHAHGEVLMFVDADGIFARDTIEQMLRALDEPSVGAVCGDDRPVNLDRTQTRLLSLISHVGTGIVRRALALLGCLHIVSGNIGAFPRRVVEQVGGFREDTVGEDLELTWRVRAAGYRIAFCPSALVYAESPSTVGGLWRQRVRWARGLLQTMRIHWRLVGNPRQGRFGAYLFYNALAMVVVPLLQLLALVVLPVLFLQGGSPIDADPAAVVAWVGLSVSVVLVLIAIALDKAWSDLRFLWTVVIWPAYSIMIAATMAYALAQEMRGRPAPWNKLDRTGVVSAGALRSSG
jgi:cellulose synthase/poly-beta-1,6-N-acetylglucosamine synthase-like glycosyltransferase